LRFDAAIACHIILPPLLPQFRHTYAADAAMPRAMPPCRRCRVAAAADAAAVTLDTPQRCFSCRHYAVIVAITPPDILPRRHAIH